MTALAVAMQLVPLAAALLDGASAARRHGRELVVVDPPR